MKLRHFILGACAFLVVMVLALAVHVTVKIADSTIPLLDPWPFLLWATAWYLFLVLVVWIADRVGA